MSKNTAIEIQEMAKNIDIKKLQHAMDIIR
jgi:hypothetical protein